MKADVEKASVRWTVVRHLRRSDSDDGRAGERRELAATPSYSAKTKRSSINRWAAFSIAQKGMEGVEPVRLQKTEPTNDWFRFRIKK